MMYSLIIAVRYININEGFTVIGWYKIGAITDKMLVSPNGGRTDAGNNGDQMDYFQVDDGEVNFYFTNIDTNDSSFLYPNTCKSALLVTMKFYV